MIVYEVFDPCAETEQLEVFLPTKAEAFKQACDMSDSPDFCGSPRELDLHEVCVYTITIVPGAGRLHTCNLLNGREYENGRELIAQFMDGEKL